MRKFLLGLGLVVGAGVVAMPAASSYAKDEKHASLHCAKCKGEMKDTEACCGHCGEHLKAKDGKMHCDHCKADMAEKDTVCPKCKPHEDKHK